MARTVVIEEYAKTRSKRVGTAKRYAVLALFLVPFLAAFIVFFIVPLIYGIHISLTNFVFSAPGKEVANDFMWYKYLLFNENALLADGFTKGQAGAILKIQSAFWNSFTNSIVFSIIMVPIAVLLPLGLAILVNTKPPGYKAFRSMIYLPSIVPLSAAGAIFTLLFADPNANGLLSQWFGIDIKWFNDIWFDFALFGKTIEVPYAWVPIFFMCLWGGWGSNFLILSAGLQNIPANLFEAASIDGCSTWRKITNIIIPGIKPQLTLCLFTTIIGYLGLYGQNYVLSNGGPINSASAGIPGGGKTSTVIYFIQNIVAPGDGASLRDKFYGLGAAASIIYAIIVGIISGIQMYCTRDVKTGTKISEAYSKWQRIR